MDVHSPDTVPHWFRIQAAAKPHSPAVRISTGRLTYADLDAKTDALRDRLASAGLKQGALAGVLLSRSAAVITSFLGILKAGGAFVPLDPASPPDVILGLVRRHKLACIRPLA
jgi:acyl-CoA synthetase (AMP-forming)/AMP-acid ligase II